MRVLVIEDDQETAAFLKRALKESGHVAEHAADGEAGLDLARTNAYDVLIVDRMLPKLDGLGVIRSLRTAEIHTPALILSALGRGRRPRQGIAGRWRRLSHKALCVQRTLSAHRGAGPPYVTGRRFDAARRSAISCSIVCLTR